MKRTCILIAALCYCCALTWAQSSRPNIVFLFTDDQRFDSFGALGNPDVKTPHMDRLIESGTLFTQAHIQGSMITATCLPSRAMIMSGKSLFRAPMQLDTGLLLPQALQSAGYTTFATGKWHNGQESFLRCFEQAEAVFFGGASRTHTNVPLNYREGEEMIPYEVPGEHATTLFADAAIAFLKSQQDSDTPFFCYVPFTAPHTPHTPPGEYGSMYDPKKISLPPNHSSVLSQDESRSTPRGSRRSQGQDPQARYAAYYGMISHLDHHIGRITSAINQYDHSKDTLIILATDHGYSFGSHGENNKANGYEHGSRSTIAFTGPQIPPGKRTPALAYLLDLYPTLCDLAGTSIPPSIDGKSLLPVITGEKTSVRETLFTAFMTNQRTIRNERWKLFSRLGDGPDELFDLKNDPHELRNLANQAAYAPLIQQLKTQLDHDRLQAGDSPERVQQIMQSRRGGRRGSRNRTRPNGN